MLMSMEKKKLNWLWSKLAIIWDSEENFVRNLHEDKTKRWYEQFLF